MGIELELSYLLLLLTVGMVSFGRFEADRAIWRGLLKWAILIGGTVGLYTAVGHWSLLFPTAGLRGDSNHERRHALASSDPLSGQTKLVNVASGTETTIGVAPTPEGKAVVEETPSSIPEQTVFDILSEGVGLGATLREGLSTTAGQVFEGQTYPETTIARTKIKGLREKNW